MQTQLDAMKFNVIELAKDHRAKCDASCNISLFLLRLVAERAGIEFTPEEKQLFI